MIDENALTRMLDARRDRRRRPRRVRARAGDQPQAAGKLDNVVLLPHMGSATIEGRIDMGEKVIINIKTFVDGHSPPDRVHAAMF